MLTKKEPTVEQAEAVKEKIEALNGTPEFSCSVCQSVYTKTQGLIHYLNETPDDALFKKNEFIKSIESITAPLRDKQNSVIDGKLST